MSTKIEFHNVAQILLAVSMEKDDLAKFIRAKCPDADRDATEELASLWIGWSKMAEVREVHRHMDYPETRNIRDGIVFVTREKREAFLPISYGREKTINPNSAFELSLRRDQGYLVKWTPSIEKTGCIRALEDQPFQPIFGGVWEITKGTCPWVEGDYALANFSPTEGERVVVRHQVRVGESAIV